MFSTTALGGIASSFGEWGCREFSSISSVVIGLLMFERILIFIVFETRTELTDAVQCFMESGTIIVVDFARCRSTMERAFVTG